MANDEIVSRLQTRQSLSTGFKDASFNLLGIGVTILDLPRLLMIAVQAYEAIEKQQTEFKLDLPFDGSSKTSGPLEPRKGESFVSCGKCEKSRWLATTVDATGAVGHLMCAACGNELSLTQMTHPGGHV